MILIMLYISLFLSIISHTTCKAVEEKTAEEYYISGNEYYGKGLYQQAITAFNQAINLNPKLADAYTAHGHAYARIEQPNLGLAIADFDQAIKLNPLNDYNYIGRGTTYAMQGHLDKAILDFNKAIKLNNENALAYSARALANYHKGDYDKAWQDADKAQSLGLPPPPEFMELLRKSSAKTPP